MEVDMHTIISTWMDIIQQFFPIFTAPGAEIFDADCFDYAQDKWRSRSNHEWTRISNNFLDADTLGTSYAEKLAAGG
jgi:hypothetical protein